MTELIDVDLPVAEVGNDPNDFRGHKDYVTELIGNERRIEVEISPEPISEEEWNTSLLTPPCIVENYLWNDIVIIAAGGGTGKTTLQLFEAIHIALGWDLYGLSVRKRGSTVFLTAEDSRPQLIARLRHLTEELNLDPQHIKTVMESVLIKDMSNMDSRLLEYGKGQAIQPAELVEHIIKGLKPLNPVQVIIDPAVSFGVSENAVNDNAHGLIKAARLLRNGLECCVKYIHHTGQQAFRDKQSDQYAGRGGSAMSDGARMVHVLHQLEANELSKETGYALGEGEIGLRLSRPKSTYAPPQNDIYLVRDGYHYTHLEEVKGVATPTEKAKRDKTIVMEWIRACLDAGGHLSFRKLNAEYRDHDQMAEKRLQDIIKLLLEEGVLRQGDKERKHEDTRFLYLTSKEKSYEP